jgi:hypothetical protein
VRVTLEIDDDVMDAAKRVARLKGQGLGRTISELARRGLVPEARPTVDLQEGIPVWTHKPDAIPVTSEMVRSLA